MQFAWGGGQGFRKVELNKFAFMLHILKELTYFNPRKLIVQCKHTIFCLWWITQLCGCINLTLKSTIWWPNYFGNCMWILCMRAKYQCLKWKAGELCLIALWLCPCVVFYCSLPNSQLSKQLVPGAKTGSSHPVALRRLRLCSSGLSSKETISTSSIIWQGWVVFPQTIWFSQETRVSLNAYEKVSYFKDKTRAPSAGLNFRITLTHINMHRLPMTALGMI